jgi:hypothetical protein
LTWCLALREFWVTGFFSVERLLGNLPIFPWLVIAVAIWRIRATAQSVQANSLDFFAILLIALLCTFLASDSSKAGIGLAIGMLGVFALWRGQNDEMLYAGAVCLMAVCANLSLAPLIFQLGYSNFIGVDMALLQYAINASGAPVTATPAGLVASDGMRVMLVGGCSSFAGVSAAVLVHMGWAMFVRTEVNWRDAVAVCATVLVATVLNIIRLTLTASGHDAYLFWHGNAGELPLGGQLFWFLQNAILLAGGYVSATLAGRPARAARPA